MPSESKDVAPTAKAVEPQVKAVDELDLPVMWDERWPPETAQLAYDHSHEVYRQVDAATDVIDRKVVSVFTVTSAIAAIGPAVSNARLWSAPWWLTVGAAAMWAAAATQCWVAYKPRTYRTDPDVATMATPGWLSLSPGAFLARRLGSLRKSVRDNVATTKERAAAVRRALIFALLEVGFLLAALLAAR